MLQMLATPSGAVRGVVAAAIAAVMWGACAPAAADDAASGEPTFESESYAMGTRITQRATGVRGQAAIEAVTAAITRLESMMTFKAPSGDVHKINRNAGSGPVDLHPETVTVIRKALQVAELSAGAFDVTVGPLVQLWSTAGREHRIPAKQDIDKILTLVDYRDLHIDGRSGGLKRAGQLIDLGGIAKGYAADVAIGIYKAHGIRSAFVNLGGNVFTLGDKPDGTPWKIGIRNPRPGAEAAEDEQILGYITVRDRSVTTSGDDQRFFEKDGRRYHHIVDPRTGYPAQSDLMSVTLVAESSLDADAFDTAVFILGLEKGRELLRRLGNIEGIFVTVDRKIYVTDGLKDNFVFHDPSGEYQYLR